MLQDRVKHVNKLNADIADWLQVDGTQLWFVNHAYRLLGTAPHRGNLRTRLAEARPETAAGRIVRSWVRKSHLAATKRRDGGLTRDSIFSTPWQKIVSSTDDLAESHHTLAQKIEADVERPLRDFATTNREMQAMSTISGNLAAMAREVENAQKKSDKVRGKGEKAAANKVAQATSEVEYAMSQWESQAPFVFEKLQAVDESRLNHLRDVLTQFQTHEVDQVERSRVTAEQCLNALLNVETEEEIRSFSSRAVSGRPKLERPGSSRVGPSSSLAPTSSIPTTDDRSSQKSGSGMLRVQTLH